MNRPPQPAAPVVEIARGASAAAPGVLWLHHSRAVVAADVHLAYEDVIGGALPTWSTAELVATLLVAVRTLGARELILLGDVIHGSRMSDGAAREVARGLAALRQVAQVTIVAGNHEGRSRGAAILGETVEEVVRDGWLLLHGDRPPKIPQPCIIGHLHPSLAMGSGASVPAFLAGEHVVVLPALTPYSGGLDAASDACLQALRPFNVSGRSGLHVVAVTGDLCYPFGTLSELQKALQRPATPRPNRFRRKFLRPD